VPPLYATAAYALRIVFDATHKLDDYGVVNKQTGIIENFTNNIGRGRFLVDAATKLVQEGYKDPVDGLMEALARASMEDAADVPTTPRGRKLS
jgi:3-deoxy-D-manno-octulosonic acid (KDO) 8-phosphate synthase